MSFNVAPSPSVPQWRSLFQKLALTWAASSILKVSWPQQCAKAASLLHLSGNVPIAFLPLCSARSAAKTFTGSFCSTEFRSGLGNALFLCGCGRWGDKLASWALWGFMPISKCVSPTLHCLKDILYTEITELLR